MGQFQSVLLGDKAGYVWINTSTQHPLGQEGLTEQRHVLSHLLLYAFAPLKRGM